MEWIAGAWSSDGLSFSPDVTGCLDYGWWYAARSVADGSNTGRRLFIGESSSRVATLRSVAIPIATSCCPTGLVGRKRAGSSPVNVVARETIEEGLPGPFSVERRKMDLPFVNVLCVQTSSQRSGRPCSFGPGNIGTDVVRSGVNPWFGHEKPGLRFFNSLPRCVVGLPGTSVELHRPEVTGVFVLNLAGA